MDDQKTKARAHAAPWEWWEYEGSRPKLTGGAKPPGYSGPWTTLLELPEGHLLNDADRRLIAAAPELLSALRNLHSMAAAFEIYRDSVGEVLLAEVEAAISKATS